MKAPLDHAYTYGYDMRSQLTDANITNIIGGDGLWTAYYSYHNSGDMYSRTIESDTDSFTYKGHLMATLDSTNLAWDENGNLILSSHESQATSHEYNWDGKLRSAAKGSTTIGLKYDPDGNRIRKQTISGSTTTRKYIVDIAGNLPVILMELDATDYTVKKTYIYANSQILAQHDGDTSAQRYFYLHDRLGSVRLIIDSAGNVKKYYTYDPFGKTIEESSDEPLATSNCFMFTGQFYDSEIGEYYLRARMYDPHISRFTSRDPVFGDFKEPLTLHAYLYCINNPINMIDPAGLWGEAIHNQIILAAFPEFMTVSPPENPYEAMFRGSAWVDRRKFQDAEHAYMHAMTNAETHQSVAEAKRQMYGFVWENYDLYKRYENLGEEDLAYNYLGRALHPIMDWTCPAHDWQAWNPGVLGVLEGAAHLWVEPETIDDIKLKDTIWLIQHTMKQLDPYYELSQIQLLANY